MADSVWRVVMSALGQKRSLGAAQKLSVTEQDDADFDDEDVAAIAVLKEADIEAIDHAILAQCESQWRKVASVVSAAMEVHPDRYFDIPDIYYSERVRHLVAAGRLDAQGNMARMRFSEVRLLSKGEQTL